MKKAALLFFLFTFFCSISLAQKTAISGRVLGNDGKPLAKAAVEVYNEDSNKFSQIPVSTDGRFSLETSSKFIKLRLSGVNHKSMFLPLIIHNATSLTFDVLLATNSYTDNFSKVKLICSINNYSSEKAFSFKKNEKGIYAVDIETDKDTIQYELIGLSKNDESHSWNGTMSDDYKYDTGGDFRSVIYKKEKIAHIEFDPSKLIAENPEAKIASGDETLPEIIMMKEDVLYTNKLNKIHLDETANRNKMPDLSAMVEDLRSKAYNEKDQYLKGFYCISYLKLWPFIEKDKFDTIICKQTLEIVPPESDLWMINPNLLMVASRAYKYNKDIYDKYISEVVNKQNNLEVKAEALRHLILEAKFNGDTTSFNNYVQRIMKECPNTYQAKSIKNDFFTLIIGNDVPEFEVKSLSDEKITYSNKTLKGKFYIMDFWATWCGPCMGELPKLHEAYKEFRGKNFEILSISVDENRQIVEKFRKEKYEMPWLHAFLEKGIGNEIAKRFGIDGIPKVVLVSDKGKILATDNEVRGENLRNTLLKYLDSSSVSK